MKKLERFEGYIPPKVEMLDVNVEAGFAFSPPVDLSDLENGGTF